MRGQEKRVTLLHPAGFPVRVSEVRAEVFKGRGYTVPRPKPKPKKDEPVEG